ncbi:MAG TPA: hypothetical protein VIU63_06505 [Nitrospira sp.]
MPQPAPGSTQLVMDRLASDWHLPSIPAHAPSAQIGLFEAAGIMILSSSTRILHMNSRARTLMGLFGEAHESWPNLTSDCLPSILLEFCRDILSELALRTETQDWARFEIRRVCHMVSPPLLLRGFGIPTVANREPQMILTLQSCITHPSCL